MFAFIIREAVLSDGEAINALSSGIYQNADITQNLFPEWVNDELWLPYVAETNLGQVVGFLALNITDGERSVVVRSSRVAEEFRGRGLYKQMLNSALIFAKQKHSNLNCIIRARPAHIRVPLGYNVIKHCSKIILSCTPTSVEAIPSPQFPATTIPLFNEQHLTVEGVAKLYEEDETFRKLFDGGILTVEGETFHLDVKENWALLQKRNDIAFNYTHYDPNSTNTSAVLSVLCLSSKETNDGKPYITINIFGKEALMVGYHILKAMKTATLSAGIDYNLGVFVDMELELAVCDFAEEELDFCKILWKRNLVVQETDFESHFLC